MLKKLIERSSVCELCAATDGLEVYAVPPFNDSSLEHNIVVCEKCHTELTSDSPKDANHWRCLNDSMWAEEPAIKVVAYRVLSELKSEGWPLDLLEMMYLDEETQAWADTVPQTESQIVHIDSNNVVLTNGDTVVLIKDLDVKGSSLTAKRGTAVRNIRLDPNNDQFIEGKVDGQQIVILTKFVKKS